MQVPPWPAAAVPVENPSLQLRANTCSADLQTLQAHQVETQRRQAEEAARLQAERSRLEIMQQSLAMERKSALDAVGRGLPLQSLWIIPTAAVS